MTTILGIDPSLTRLGYCVQTLDAYRSGESAQTGVVQPGKMRGMRRLEYVLQSVEHVIDTFDPDLIVLEGYAMGRHLASSLVQLAELGGGLKLLFHRRNLPWLLVPPSSLKLFATGHGNADKLAVRVAMAELHGTLFDYDDEADAFALALMGLGYVDRRLLPRDRTHPRRRALAGCEFVAH